MPDAVLLLLLYRWEAFMMPLPSRGWMVVLPPLLSPRKRPERSSRNRWRRTANSTPEWSNPREWDKGARNSSVSDHLPSRINPRAKDMSYWGGVGMGREKKEVWREFFIFGRKGGPRNAQAQVHNV
jgi:hypothetical protein